MHPRLACLLSILGFSSALLAADYTVSPLGDDAAKGTNRAPFLTLERALQAVKTDAAAAGSTVWLADGEYVQSAPLVLGAACSGTAQAPFVLRAVHPGRAILRAGTVLAANRFSLALPLVGDWSEHDRAQFFDQPARLLSHLQPAALPYVRIARLAGTPAADLLDHGGVFLSQSGWRLSEARWPDKGYAHVQKIIDKGAIWAAGRTPGPRPVSSLESPNGGEFTLREAWKGDWERELAAGISAPVVHGYFGADWLPEYSRLARVNAGALKLMSDSRYGFGNEEKLMRRVYITGLLSELDRPGEWFWDATEKTLYLWPVSTEDNVTLSSDFDLLAIQDAAHVTVRDLVFEGARGGITVRGGTSVILAGNDLRNLKGAAIKITGGRFHRVEANDIHAVDTPVEITGTTPDRYQWDRTTTPPRLRPDGFVVTNNHIWQCENSRGVRLHGVGNVFSHNLVHDLPGSALNWTGNDNIIEYNEFYSVLKELGDWGVTYSGATWFSFGNVHRYNFVHHIMSLPEVHPVNGFYFDDHKAGDTTFGNVFYKVGYRTVMCNDGPAQKVLNNVFIGNYVNVYQTGTLSAKAREARARYDAGELKRGDKGDFWWRVEQVVGPTGWNTASWGAAYPEFKQMMALDPYTPVLTKIARNYEMGTRKDAIWLHKVDEGQVAAEPMMPITDQAFVDPAVLNFAFKANFKPVAGFERIPFEQIGLVKSEYRKSLPDKDAYRRQVRVLYQDRESFDPKAIYDWKTMNDQLYPDLPYWNR